jgi:TPR repeat protein
MLQLGKHYEQGIGVTRDLNKAYFWYREAFLLGVMQAHEKMKALSKLLQIKGLNNVDVFKQMAKKASNGNVEAQFSIGKYYAQQINFLPHHQNLAIKWLVLASKQGHVEASLGLGVIYYQKGDDSKAIEYFQKASNAGDVRGTFNMAHLYADEDSSFYDIKQSFYLYQQSANKGYAPAINNLARFYFEGIGIAKNSPKAFNLYLKAAQLQEPTAQNSVGSMLYNGMGVKKDKAKAIIWFKQAARQGNLNAKLNLADIYLMDKSYQEARYWFEQAAKENSAYAQLNLAKMYENGDGIPKDKSKASFWYKKARASSIRK